ncbi:Gp49 family protein [Roseovarius mucosus]|uniref:Gp49 family protein n=1 Tax=Roseovarius mucosus TaxID=215743 RepID=UPI002151244B|nr:Gp49 family protein [Roseovarius mucosus]
MKTTLTDGSPVTADHRDIGADGQQKGYVVLSAEDRAKGFVQPVRRSYVHLACGGVTTMGLAIAETYARSPDFYAGTFCCNCGAHFPVGADGEFVWEGTDMKVGTIQTIEETVVSKDENAIESEISRKGLTAPRITPDMLDAEIMATEFHVFAGSCLTVCALTLRNGFTVTGESACASPENFDAAIGQKIARANAREKLWPLLGFRLRDQLSAEVS